MNLQLITITNHDDPMFANQHQELPVGPVNYCFQQFTVSTLVFVLTYVYAFSTFPCRHTSICEAFILYYFLNNLLSKVSYNFSQLYFL